MEICKSAVVNADDEEGYYAAAADNDEDGVNDNLKTKIIMKRNIKIKLFWYCCCWKYHGFDAAGVAAEGNTKTYHETLADGNENSDG